MGRIPTLRAQDVISVLEKFRFEVARQRGSHIRMRHQDRRSVTVPFHSGQHIGRGLMRKILRDAEIAPDEFLRMLQG